LHVRAEEPASHPINGQQALGLEPVVFALQRTPPAGGGAVLCLVKASPSAGARSEQLAASESEISSGTVVDLLGGAQSTVEGAL